MNELTIIIDNWSHKELKEYLKSLKGISEINIKNEEQLEIYIKYDSKIITPKIIKYEILTFLDILKTPSILSFDKHPKITASNYTITRNDFCCEYCFKSAIENLLEIEGIEKVDSNFNEEYISKKYAELEPIKINIKYNPNLISLEEMKQIDLNFDI